MDCLNLDYRIHGLNCVTLARLDLKQARILINNNAPRSEIFKALQSAGFYRWRAAGYFIWSRKPKRKNECPSCYEPLPDGVRDCGSYVCQRDLYS